MADVIKFKKGVAEKPFNNLKWVAIFVLFFAALTANYHFTQLMSVVRLGLWLLLSLGLFGIFITTTQGHRFYTFAKAARDEMRKVVWPTRQETMQSTIAVVVLVAVLALVLWLIDSFWLWVVTLLN